MAPVNEQWFSGADAAGNPIEFDAISGRVREPAERPEPEPRVRTAREENDEPIPNRLATPEDVRRYFLIYLGRLPLSDAEAEGYGRYTQTVAYVRNEISTSPEAIAFELRQPTPPKPPPPATPTPPTFVVPEIPGIKGIFDALADILARLRVDQQNSTDTVRGIAADVERQLASAAANVAPSIGRAIDSVKGQLDSAVKQVAPDVMTAVGGALGNVGGLVGAFFQAAADVADVAGAFVKAVKDQQLGINTFISNAVSGIFDNAARGTIAALADPEFVRDLSGIAIQAARDVVANGPGQAGPSL